MIRNPLAVCLFIGSTLMPGIEPRAAEFQDSIEQASGQMATVSEDGVVRLAWARDDVPVTVDGLNFPAAAGLGSWAAFKAGPDHTMLMGDTVVFEDEINLAMDAAFEHGLEVTALHNHFIYDDPPVFFMHIGGMGEAEELAAGVKATWDAIKTLRQEQPTPQRRAGAAQVSSGTLDPAPLQDILAVEAEVSELTVKFTFPEEGTMHGIDIGASMGLTTWAAFIGSDDNAAVDGDFMMKAEEVQSVLRTLRGHGIDIVALHNHMIGEEPTAYFVHYWGRGAARELATGIRAAIDARAAPSTLE